MLTRIITGVVGIALAAVVIQMGGLLFAAMGLVLMLVAWFEYVMAFRHKGMNPAFLTGVLVLLLLWGCAAFGNTDELLMTVTAMLLVILLLAVFRRGHMTFVDAAVSAAGVLYLGLPFSDMVMLRAMDTGGTMLPTAFGPMEFGCVMIWIMFIGTWSSDSFAYFAGSAFGRHKLCPLISPNKTVEGFLGGVAGTVVMTGVLGWFFQLPVPECCVLGLVIALLATVGDLVESIAKRYTGIKDSGKIIPGHGGVWDRFDSCLFTAPFVYYFAAYVLSETIH